MNLSRRQFLGASIASGAALMFPGCCNCACGDQRLGKLALQLYSIRYYINGDAKKGIKGVGIEQALKEVKAMGYEGIEFAGYYNKPAKELAKLLADNGLKACGTHIGREVLAPDKIGETCEFNRELGNKFICCPGGGNMPPGWKWDGKGKPSKETDDFIKMICDYYNRAARDAAKYGCIVGLHNHQWEFQVKMTDGTTYWDYFFSHTDPSVQMEQDVGWTTTFGADPCEQYRKYPHRSYTLHAKENDQKVPDFQGILGQPGKGVKAVDWDRLFQASDADGVEWYVVECERNCDRLDTVKASIDFLKSKGRG